jgi:hypothetical protein
MLGRIVTKREDISRQKILKDVSDNILILSEFFKIPITKEQIIAHNKKLYNN